MSANPCPECGHQHASPEWGGICIGCPCPVVDLGGQTINPEDIAAVGDGPTERPLCDVTIATEAGSYVIRGIASGCGRFAAHKLQRIGPSDELAHDWWVITHLQTGMRFPECLLSAPNALAMLDELSKLKFIDPESPDSSAADAVFPRWREIRDRFVAMEAA